MKHKMLHNNLSPGMISACVLVCEGSGLSLHAKGLSLSEVKWILTDAMGCRLFIGYLIWSGSR